MENILCPLQQASQESPHKTFIEENCGSFTYLEFYHAVCGCSSFLREQGLKEGQTVGILSENTVDTLIVFYSCLRMGVINCILNKSLPDAELADALAQIKADYFLCDSKNPNIESINAVSIKNIHQLSTQQTFHFDTDQPDEYIAFEKPATMLFTSGSSNKPKVALHSFKNHYSNAVCSNKHLKFEKKSCWHLMLPVYHVSGLSVFFRALLAQASILVSKGFSKNTKSKPTHISLVTTQLLKYLSEPPANETLKDYQCILIGGGPVNPALIARAIDNGLRIYVTYGLTEMSSQVATTKQLCSLKDIGEIAVLDCCQIKIESDNEIAVKGESLFLGYFNNGMIQKPFDAEGWLHTNDLGQLSGKSLQIFGRKDNLLISGGENIQPEEIELCIKESGLADEAIVIGVSDEKFNQRPIAFLHSDDQVTEKKLRNTLAKKLPKYKIPDAFFRLSTALTQTNLKVSRKNLSEFFKNNPDSFEKIQ